MLILNKIVPINKMKILIIFTLYSFRTMNPIIAILWVIMSTFQHINNSTGVMVRNLGKHLISLCNYWLEIELTPSLLELIFTNIGIFLKQILEKNWVTEILKAKL